MAEVDFDEKLVEFNEDWLKDVGSSIEKDPNNKYFYRCKICDKSYKVVNLSTIKKHLKTKAHENMACGIPAPKKRESKRSQVFKFQWIEEPLFKPFLQEDPDDVHMFRCKICKMSFSCLAGRMNIERHRLRYHAEEIINVPPEDTNFVLPVGTPEIRRKCAEADYAKLVAETGVSHRTAAKFLKFFQIVGKDRATLQDMRMSRIKLSNVKSNVQ